MSATPITTVHTVSVPSIGAVPITVTEQGSGRPVLLLHGGAGPRSVADLAAALAATESLRVLSPTHPGFENTARPTELSGIPALAQTYSALLAMLNLKGVTVLGSSIGGWLAAELALLADPRIGRLVLVDAVGLELPAEPIVDFFSLTMDHVAELSYRQPDRFRIDVEALPPAAKATMAGNRSALLAYGGRSMSDPRLLDRLPAIALPTLVVWGAADRIAPPAHGRAYAAAIPGAEFELIDEAGHLPQLEALPRLLGAVTRFLNTGLADQQA